MKDTERWNYALRWANGCRNHTYDGLGVMKCGRPNKSLCVCDECMPVAKRVYETVGEEVSFEMWYAREKVSAIIKYHTVIDRRWKLLQWAWELKHSVDSPSTPTSYWDRFGPNWRQVYLKEMLEKQGLGEFA